MTMRRNLMRATAAAALALTLAPVFAQGVIKIGEVNSYKVQPAFLEPYKKGMELAVEEINAAGGVMGRKLEVMKEDSVNPQTASTKAERMIERDKVACIIGEISSASCLTIAQVAQRIAAENVNLSGGRLEQGTQRFLVRTVNEFTTVEQMADAIQQLQTEVLIGAHRIRR